MKEGGLEISSENLLIPCIFNLLTGSLFACFVGGECCPEGREGEELLRDDEDDDPASEWKEGGLGMSSECRFIA